MHVFAALVTTFNRPKCKAEEPCEKCGRDNHHTLMCRDTDSIEGSASTDENSDNKSDSGTDDKDDERSAESNAAESSSLREIALYPIHEAEVEGCKKKCIVFCDGGSNVSYITHRAAKHLKAKYLRSYTLEVRTTGGVITTYNTCQYEIKLLTAAGNVVPIKAYGMENIAGNLAKIHYDSVVRLFPEWGPSLLMRKCSKVDVLLGADYFGLQRETGIRWRTSKYNERPTGDMSSGNSPMAPR